VVILGLDTGTYTCGVSILRWLEDGQWEPIDGMALNSFGVKGQLFIDASGDTWKAFEDDRYSASSVINAWLLEEGRADRVDVCFVEQSILRGGASAHGNTACAHRVMGLLDGWGVDSSSVASRTWGAHFAASSAAGEAAAASRALCREIWADARVHRKLIGSQHFADSVAIAVAGAELGWHTTLTQTGTT
jgi:hypothetical protein